jgi:hypothetical protein
MNKFNSAKDLCEYIRNAYNSDKMFRQAINYAANRSGIDLDALLNDPAWSNFYYETDQDIRALADKYMAINA